MIVIFSLYANDSQHPLYWYTAAVSQQPQSTKLSWHTTNKLYQTTKGEMQCWKLGLLFGICASQSQKHMCVCMLGGLKTLPGIMSWVTAKLWGNSIYLQVEYAFRALLIWRASWAKRLPVRKILGCLELVQSSFKSQKDCFTYLSLSASLSLSLL